MASFRKVRGSWEYRIRYKDRQSGKWKETSKSGFATKKEAQLAASEANLDMEYYGFQEDGKETMFVYMEKWFELYKRPYMKQTTIDLQERNIKNNILPRWGNYKLREITRSEYTEWLLELSKKYATGSIRRIHSIMSAALNDAVHEFRILRETPLSRVKIPKTNEDTKIKFYSVEEMNALIEASKMKVKHAKYQQSNMYYAMNHLLGHTGLRIGECLALTWDDIDLENAKLSVDKTVTYPDKSNKPVVTSTKTTSSERVLELDRTTVAVLKTYRINQKELYLRYPGIVKPEDKLLFHTAEGLHYRANVVREQFKVFCKRANVPVLSPHALRHSHAVHLLEAGANIKYVSSRLGHKSIKVTADTYLHITKKIERNALDLYEKHINL